jgi:ACS family hexuronate transporter-like MFS transporter
MGKKWNYSISMSTSKFRSPFQPVGGFSVVLLIPTILTVNLYVLTLLFALATFSYASFTTIANVLPSDLYKNESVATVSGLRGTGAALGTIIVFELASHLSDARIARGDTLVRSAHGYRGPDSLCGDDSRAYAGAQ